MKRLAWFNLIPFLQLKTNTDLKIDDVSSLQAVIEQLAQRITDLEDA